MHLVSLEVPLGDGRSEGGIGGDEIDEEGGRRSESVVDDRERVSVGEGEGLRSDDEVTISIDDGRKRGVEDFVGAECGKRRRTRRG